MSKRCNPTAFFWAHVTKTETCWLWTGATNGKLGYGKIYPGGGRKAKPRMVYAHRFSWELHYGPVPDGLKVLHACDTGPCVRPSHLFLGTNKINSEDMARKGRAPMQRASREVQIASAAHMRSSPKWSGNRGHTTTTEN